MIPRMFHGSRTCVNSDKMCFKRGSRECPDEVCFKRNGPIRNGRHFAAVVGAIWIFRSTFWPGGYILSLSWRKIQNLSYCSTLLKNRIAQLAWFMILKLATTWNEGPVLDKWLNHIIPFFSRDGGPGPVLQHTTKQMRHCHIYSVNIYAYIYICMS